MAKSVSHCRDQVLTPFAPILEELCAATGSQCVALVDAEGETVDYGGQGDPFEIRVLAAEWRIILERLKETSHLRHCSQFIVRASQKSFLVAALPEEYALVMQLARRATTVSPRALCNARRNLCREAGFSYPEPLDGDWRRVKVEEEAGHTRRPGRVTIDENDQSLTILGRVLAEDAVRERSYRVRLQSGEERTLVREPLGYWYMESGDWVPVSRCRTPTDSS